MTSKTEEIVLGGLQQGLRNRIASLFEVMASPTTSADAGAEHFRKSVAECLVRYETAYKTVNDLDK